MQKIFIIILAVMLSACATSRNNFIMPPLSYHGTAVHLPGKAYLYWKEGTVLAGARFAGQSDDVIVSLIANEYRKHHPSEYQYAYDKAEQASFITNFRDVLNEHHVFKEVNILLNPKDAKAGLPIIEVNFKTTRVSGFERNHRIILTVELTIRDGKKTFDRTYMVESDEGTEFKGKSFDEQIVDVSQQLVAKLIDGIKQWSNLK